jgi:Domain of unknown function (DUF4124)
MNMSLSKVLRTGLPGVCLLASSLCWSAAAPIWKCVDASGKAHTSDREIPECQGRPQTVLNGDGSADADALEKQRKIDAERYRDAIRRDRNLLTRFPNEAAHRKAREAALDDSRKSMQRSDVRISLLTKERKPLLDEAEFYVGKPLPAQLKQQLDANDAAVRAQVDLLRNQQDEIKRINALFDVELERLKSLWGGAQPGSMGVLPVNSAASAPPRRAPVSRASASEPR